MALDKQNKNVTNYYKILLRKYPRKFVPIWIELDIWRKSEINKEMKPFSLIIINYATQKKSIYLYQRCLTSIIMW